MKERTFLKEIVKLGYRKSGKNNGVACEYICCVCYDWIYVLYDLSDTRFETTNDRYYKNIIQHMKKLHPFEYSIITHRSEKHE